MPGCETLMAPHYLTPRTGDLTLLQVSARPQSKVQSQSVPSLVAALTDIRWIDQRSLLFFVCNSAFHSLLGAISRCPFEQWCRSTIPRYQDYTRDMGVRLSIISLILIYKKKNIIYCGHHKNKEFNRFSKEKFFQIYFSGKILILIIITIIGLAKRFLWWLFLTDTIWKELSWHLCILCSEQRWSDDSSSPCLFLSGQTFALFSPDSPSYSVIRTADVCFSPARIPDSASSRSIPFGIGILHLFAYGKSLVFVHLSVRVLVCRVCAGVREFSADNCDFRMVQHRAKVFN